MNRQQVFDQVVSHARQQGKKSEDVPGGNKCLYRGRDGLKCFAGALVRDDEYSYWMEGMDIQMVLRNYRCPQTLISRLDPVHNGIFLNTLQTVHDNWSVEEWERILERVAKEYNLEYKAP